MSVEIARKQNILVTDFHLLKSLLVVFGFGSQAFVCGSSRQNINSVSRKPCKRRSTKWTNESTKINRVIQKTVLLENRVSRGLPVLRGCKQTNQMRILKQFCHLLFLPFTPQRPSSRRHRYFNHRSVTVCVKYVTLYSKTMSE